MNEPYQVNHKKDYDPAEHFVRYFADDAPEPTVEKVTEEWEDAQPRGKKK